MTTEIAAAENRVVQADQAWSVEGHAIEPIPLADRHGSPIELFRMWIGANINYVAMLTGALPVTQGLPLWGALSAVLVGNLLGSLVAGLASIMGPRTGTAGIVTSRTSFGQLGAILPIAVSTLSAMAWFSIDSMVATQSLTQMFGLVGLPTSAIMAWIAMFIVLLAEILVAIYGHATIIAAEKWVSLLLVIMFFGLLMIVLPHVDWSVAMAGRNPEKATAATWFLVMGLVFSYPVSWTNFASDYSRYLAPETSWRSIAKAAGAGQFVSLVFCEIVGVFFAFAVGGTLSDPVADLPKIVPAWFLAPFLLAVILGAVAANVPNGYTSGLGLLALRLPVRRISALLVIAAATLTFRVVALLYGHFFELYQQWLDSILVWTCPWVAIVTVDYFLRGGEYDTADLMLWGRGRYWYRNGIFWPGLTAFLVGLSASLLFSNSDMYASPLMIRYLGGTDLSFEAGMIAAAIVYYALCARAIRASAPAAA